MGPCQAISTSQSVALENHQHYWPMDLPLKPEIFTETSREIAGKTHTCWFDWGRAGERAEVGIRSSCTELSPIRRKRGDPSLLLCVREIDTSGGGRFLLSSVFVYFSSILGHCYYFLCFSSHQNSKSYAARWKKKKFGPRKKRFSGSPQAQAVLETVCSRNWMDVFLCNTVG